MTEKKFAGVVESAGPRALFHDFSSGIGTFRGLCGDLPLVDGSVVYVNSQEIEYLLTDAVGPLVYG